MKVLQLQQQQQRRQQKYLKKTPEIKILEKQVKV